MNRVDISVIVPVYNAEKYLKKCIDSILAQTLTNFELLLIDDGSRDNSGKICDEFARKYSFIHVIHKENGGVSSARNLGLKKASGMFIAFVDADDWVDVDYLECLYPTSDEDLVCCSFVVENNTNQTSENVFLSDCSETTEALEKNLTVFSFCSVCCKVFRKSVIQASNVCFDEQISQCEDGLFVFDYLCARHCNIRTLSKTAYHYRWDYKERNSYKNFPMMQAYLLMDLLSDRLEKIRVLYLCSNAWYLKSEMTCSQMYNVYRTVRDSGKSIRWKLKEYVTLLKNVHVRSLLTNSNYMKMKRGGLAKYYLMRLFYSIV